MKTDLAVEKTCKLEDNQIDSTTKFINAHLEWRKMWQITVDEIIWEDV